MNYIELSEENVREKCSKLYKKIIKNYDYDLVIFVAKGSFIIGKELSELNNVPLLEICATRKGSLVKNILKPFLVLFPKRLLIGLRKKEMNSTYHETKKDRRVSFDIDNYERYRSCKRILLVDDSIDSGNSIFLTKNVIHDFFTKSQVKTAVFNVMNKSKIKPDYTIYTDMMICGPWSNDSKYNKKYLKNYDEWRNSNG